ncbi:hypothetical protein [Curtobacterium sp. MCJR17_043]|uniref:hypothetical protein n=1 Tax=Curtobacterium sp. MCJR17_043 TaxID=2175660 RepID=UPI0024DF6C6B|nr:hypothetical protein [Curtobacterium sp. MCJR17_043]WIB36709.1 hypothetical protein DEJ15_06545 [Curtobacterium sp. MCJR17_043]
MGPAREARAGSCRSAPRRWGDFSTAAQQLADAGFTESAERADSSSAFGLFRSDDHRVVLTFSAADGGATATYIVTSR